MASDIIVPEVGELGMDVTFVRWLKIAGDEVAVGDPLFEVDTEKSVMVVEAYAAGTLADLRAREGDTVAPRDVIGRILLPGESTNAHPAPGGSTGTGDSSSPVPAASRGGSAVASEAVPELASAQSAAPERGRVSPRARRVAGQLGIATEGLAGSGPDGLVTESDVRAAAQRAAGPVEAPSPGASDRARRAIADLTTSSWQTIPHFFLQLEADVERGLALAKPTPLICAAVAQALTRTPECNLSWQGDTPVPRSGVDLGILVDAPGGLLITVVQDAQDLDLADMAVALRAAADRARSGKLAASDMGARSLTVSNLGMYSVDRFSAVIPKPDILTLAMGRTRTVARWSDDAFVPTRAIDLTLSVDHRALDGAAAARFMSSLEAILADPVAEGLA